MKKMLAIISVLVIIFIGMYFSKNNINQNNITVSEVNTIEEYITNIYMWQEVTQEALPKFNNINEAPEVWIWEVVKKNLDKFELTSEELEEKAIDIFGDNFNKKFPTEGTEYILYDKDTNLYYTTGIGLDSMDDCFLIKNIIKNKNGYEVEIAEYLEDYSDSIGQDETEGENIEYNVYIRNLEKETISTIKSSESETKVIEEVKNNINKFSTKKIILKKDSKGKIYVESVE